MDGTCSIEDVDLKTCFYELVTVPQADSIYIKSKIWHF